MAQKYFNSHTLKWETAPDLGLGPGIGIQRTRDILSRLPDADIAGAMGVGVVPGGENTTGARAAIMDAADINSPPTLRPLAGAQQNNRGHSIEVVLTNDSEAHTVDVGTICETGKNSGDDAELITITVGSFLDVPMFPNQGSGSMGIVGVVEWGVGGATFSSTFDWMNGTCFSICASFVRVRAIVSWFVGGGAPSRRLTISAALGYGSTPTTSTTPIRVTQGPYDLSAGQSFFNSDALLNRLVAIPDFATSMSIVSYCLQGSPFQQPDVGITFYGAPLTKGASLTDGSILGVYRWNGNDNGVQLRDGTIPIPGGSSYYNLTNLSPYEFNISAIFSMSF